MQVTDFCKHPWDINGRLNLQQQNFNALVSLLSKRVICRCAVGNCHVVVNQCQPQDELVRFCQLLLFGISLHVYGFNNK